MNIKGSIEMLETIKQTVAQKVPFFKVPEEETPLHGHPPCPVSDSLLDKLSDTELERLNDSLDWRCFTTDSKGRRLGKPASAKKRNKAQSLTDRRIALLDTHFPLAKHTVLEIGCFEGVHTTGLCLKAKKVTAVDGRIESIAKAMVRTRLYGFDPTFHRCNVEERPLPYADLKSDLIFHVGVLYHLKDPVSHLLDLKNFGAKAILLDTHYLTPKKGEDTYQTHGRKYRFTPYRETQYETDPFSGMYAEAKWLDIETIRGLLGEAGFTKVQHLEKRKSRNGNRVTLIASH